jgi:hypothetical protein
MNFVRKHWRGEYSLPRSYWLHGSLLSILVMSPLDLILYYYTETQEATETPYAGLWALSLLIYFLFSVTFAIWSTGGIWRSATHRGGFWAGTAKVMLVLGWLSAIGQTVEGFTPKQHHQVSATPHPATGEQQAAIAADLMSKTPRSELIDKMSAYVDKLYGNETRSWGRIKDWAIRVEDNLCYIYTAYPEGYILRVGVLEREGYYLTFSNVRWTEIKENQKFELNIRLGNDSPWHLTATALAMTPSPLKPLTGIFDSKFISEMASQSTMSISQGDKLIAVLDLSDARPALQSMLACQQAQNHNPPKAS